MPKAALPANETERLNALKDACILDTPAQAEYDDIASLASVICQTPIALVSLIDEQRQWFKAKVGLEALQTPRDIAFCAHAILQPEQPLVVEDATQDPRFSDNALVTDEPHIRFYAGIPLTNDNGISYGTLCVIDMKPRAIAEDQLHALRVLARSVVQLMELRKHRFSLEKLVEAQTGEIIKAKEAAERANRLKSEYLSQVSHQLLTPLNQLRQFSLSLKEKAETSSPEEMNHMLTHIHANSTRIARMVDELMDLTMLESGDAEVIMRLHRLDTTLHEAVKEVALMAEDKHLNIALSANDPIHLICDVGKIFKTCVHLLTHAMNHSPDHSTITLACHLQPDTESAVITLSYSGENLPAHIVAQLSQDSATTDMVEAMSDEQALRLAICQQMIEKHGGIMRYESTDTRSNLFTLILPNAQPAE